MKRMLINATQPEELRVAIADGQNLLDLDIEVPAQEQKKSNIYKGRITRVEPSLEACFVEFGSERHGFLPLKEIAREYFSEASAKALDAGDRVDIKDAVDSGQEIIVQVEKEERGTKGAALTTFISLAGRYLVLMPNNPRAGGVSRQVTGEDRKIIIEALRQLEVPTGMGLIVRTAGVGRLAEDLHWDLNYLLQLWEAIQTAAQARKAPFLIYQESNVIIRALRDHMRDDIGEILIDSEQVFEDAREFLQQVMPHTLRKLKRYSDPTPLFSRFQIESKIESAFAREVRLPSGGAVVIDHTEALLSIDINSARATKGADIEETALQTNLEAAEEIARQLRLRDLGGLVVIDFIDMTSRDAQRQVEDKLREAMRVDKARVQIGRISRFGLLELSRQRLRPSLGESSHVTCPRCDGYGSIRSIESLALAIIRLAEEEAMKENTGRVIVQAPLSVANFLLNEKRGVISSIEERTRTPVTVVANHQMETPRYEIQRLRTSEAVDEPSYAMAQSDELETVVSDQELQAGVASREEPAVSTMRPAQPAPMRHESVWTRVGKWLKEVFGGDESKSRGRKTPRKPAGAGGKKRTRKASSARSGSKHATHRPHKPRDQADDKPAGRKGGKDETRAKGKSGSGPKQRKDRKSGDGSRRPGDSPKAQDGRKEGQKESPKDDEKTGRKETRGGGAGVGPGGARDDGQDGGKKKKRRRRGGKKRRNRYTTGQAREPGDGNDEAGPSGEPTGNTREDKPETAGAQSGRKPEAADAEPVGSTTGAEPDSTGAGTTNSGAEPATDSPNGAAKADRPAEDAGKEPDRATAESHRDSGGEPKRKSPAATRDDSAESRPDRAPSEKPSGDGDSDSSLPAARPVGEQKGLFRLESESGDKPRDGAERHGKSEG
ncbi:MAG: Rne/Rng family ribonuclease [Wenzhouxiangellaceae bacterium]|nr:Rne/Rng family ribonuclease [Wenzhouxiangellaceae bacterium]